MRILGITGLLLLQALAGPRMAGGIIVGEVHARDGSVAAGVKVFALAAPGLGALRGASEMLAGVAETDAAGAFRLVDLPPGHYHVVAGSFDLPSYYPGVKSQAEAREILLAAGATVAANFTLVRPLSIRVSGRVKDFPLGGPPGLVRAQLGPDAQGTVGQLPEALIQSDGSFEFPNVSPGRYRIVLRMIANSSAVFTVTDEDVSSIELTMEPLVIGHVSTEDGSALPVRTDELALGHREPLAMVQFETSPSLKKPTTQNVFFTQLSSVVRTDGFFLILAKERRNQLVATQLPVGYFLKSAVNNPATNHIEVTLARTETR